MVNGWAFSDMNPRLKKKIIRAAMRIGSNCDIKEVMNDIYIDLQTDKKATLRTKSVQLMKTVPDCTLWGLPTAVSLCTGKYSTKYVSDKMDNSRPKLVKKKPIHYNGRKGYPFGMPVISYEEGKPRTDNGRKCFTFQVDYNEAEIFGKILNIAKNKSFMSKFLGDRAFTVKMVPLYRKYEVPELRVRRPIYHKMVRNNV